MNANQRLRNLNIAEVEEIKLKCSQCEHVGVCWLPSSIRGVLNAQQENTGVLMFDWMDMAQICTQFSNSGKVFLEGASGDDL